MVHRKVAQFKEACLWASRNAMNKSCEELILDGQVKNVAAERNNARHIMNNLLGEYREEVSGVVTIFLPVLNTTKLKEE